jgi:hypothetical protein
MGEEYFRYLWVGPSSAQQWMGLTALAAFLGLLLVAYLAYLRQTKMRTAWGRFSAMAIHKGCTQEDLDLLGLFYRQLKPAERKLVENSEMLQRLLFRFASHQVSLHPESVVDLYSKLCAPMSFQLDLASLQDIVIGEVMALQLPAGSFLVTMTRFNPDGSIVLRHAGPAVAQEPRPKSILYLYRSGFGAYTLRGTAQAEESGFRFSNLVQVERHRPERWMAEIDANIVLTESRLPAIETPAPDAKPLPPPVSFRAGTILISTRAVSCSGTVPKAARTTRSREWLVELPLSGGPVIQCRGRILVSRFRDRFIVRLIDLSEEARVQIEEAVRLAGPIPERIV